MAVHYYFKPVPVDFDTLQMDGVLGVFLVLPH
jgi:hypothetical protein